MFSELRSFSRLFAFAYGTAREYLRVIAFLSAVEQSVSECVVWNRSPAVGCGYRDRYSSVTSALHADITAVFSKLIILFAKKFL